jgi:peroxiredoxin
MRTLPDDTMPAIDAGLAGGGDWHIADEQPQMLALLVFYHGLQCPICRKWLGTLERLLPEFERRGVSAIALSTDTRARAEQAKRDWGLANLRIGYGVEPEDARKAGVYISEGRGAHPGTGIEEMTLFTEPAVLAIKPDGLLYMAWTQSGPHARPHFSELLSAIEGALLDGLPPPRGAA